MSRKPWSISTTVRNPARLRDFLLVLADMEGVTFNADAQREFQIRLIQHRLYRPSHIPEEYREYFVDPDIKIPKQVAENVFHAQNYEDPAMRGRQSANPLNKLGFAVAVQELGKVRITKAGQQLIEHPERASDLLFLSLLKFQYPNPLSRRDFTERQGFNIVPFLGCISLLQKLSESGVSSLHKEEFCLFVPTMIHASKVDEQAQRVLEFMRATATHRSHLKTQWVKDFYGDSTLTEKSTKFKNLYEYGDNAMRYFRFTRHLQVISDPLQGDWRISVEPLRHTENELLLSIFETYAQSFTSVEEYLEYLGDPEQPSLPWRQLDYLKRIATSLRTEILNVSASETTVSTDLLEVDLNSLSQEGLEFLIDQLRTEIRRLTLQAERDRLRLSVDKLDEHAQAISKFKRQKGVQPEDFEHLLYQILVTIDDELQIQPNYPTDDYGNPISHAPGGKADIECFYSNFAMIVEVTLDTGNFQWVREGQPVMRHLREFEERVGTENIYCLFVAPKIHDDTYSQFWFAVKYEYKGARQRILPLNSDQFRIVIEAMRSWIEKHQKADHRLLQQLLDDALEIDQVNGYDKWREHIQRTLDQWTAEVKNG